MNSHWLPTPDLQVLLCSFSIPVAGSLPCQPAWSSSENLNKCVPPCSPWTLDLILTICLSYLPVDWCPSLELTFALVLRTSTFRLSFFWQLLLPLADSLSSHGSLLTLSSSSNENNTKTDCRVQNKSKGSGAKLKLGFKSQLGPLVNLWRWASYGAFLCLNFLIFKTWIKWACLCVWISPQKEAWERVPAELNFPRVTLPQSVRWWCYSRWHMHIKVFCVVTVYCLYYTPLECKSLRRS